MWGAEQCPKSGYEMTGLLPGEIGPITPRVGDNPLFQGVAGRSASVVDAAGHHRSPR